jgi:hypothetical protein
MVEMREMTDGESTLKVSEWIIIRGIFWEYYVIEQWNEDNCAYCLVDGDFQEIGLVSLDEIKPYISARTKDLKTIQAAPGWKWVDAGSKS